jgi:long-chain acyl-CoA synthetase
MKNPATLCELHRSAAEALGPRCELRYKRDGMWRDMSWDNVRRTADRAAAALIRLGVKLGDRVALLSENRAEWIIADQAILSAGSAGVTMHAPLVSEQVAFQVSHSQAKGIIVSGEEQARKVFDVLDQLPNLEFLISFDPLPSELQGCRPIAQYTWQQMIHSSNSANNWQQMVLEREATIQSSDLATIIYTSGTTGNPKGVMLTHNNLLSNALATFGAGVYGTSDILLSWLPYSHIYARTVDLYLTISTYGTLCVGGPVDALFDDLRAVQPTWMTSVPRFYEKVWAVVEARPEAERPAFLRQIFGPRLVQLSSGGAPLPRHIAEGFMACEIPLYQGYGLTESSPVISFNAPDANRLGSVGRALPGVEVRIAPDGEILTRGPHVMRGYWRDPKATSETIIDGWLYTGDVGHLDDDGYLFITDRKKDIIVTSGGKNVVPSEIERLLTSDPLIDQAVVYGDGRQFISAIVIPNATLLEEEVKRQGWSLEMDNDIIRSTAVYDFFDQRIAAVMQHVSQPERVRRFVLLNRALSQEQGELTATLKVRRRSVIRQFETELVSLYEKS